MINLAHGFNTFSDNPNELGYVGVTEKTQPVSWTVLLLTLVLVSVVIFF